MFKYTVLIPAYNASAFIGDAVRSALRQTMPSLEILVVDDGSNDDTASVASGFGEPIRLVSVRHGGLAWARNHGMRSARGDYVLFLDADDVLEDDLAARAIGFLARRPDLGFVFSNIRTFHGPRGISQPRIPATAFGASSEAILDKPLLQVLEAGHLISSSGLCASRSKLSVAGFFDETLWGAEDLEYWSRLYLRWPVGYLAAPLVRLRRHPGSMTKKVGRMIESIVRAAERVEENCIELGRSDQIAHLRGYRRRSLDVAFRGMLLEEERREVVRLLWRHRRLLGAPRWFLLAAAAALPSRLLGLLPAVKRRLTGALTASPQSERAGRQS